MELNDIKSAWESLDNQLKKQETIKETILRKLIQEKGSKSLRKISNYEWVSLLTIVVLCPLIPYILYAYNKNFSLFSNIILGLLGLYIIAFLPIQIWKVKTIEGINYAKSIGENVMHINKFNLFLKKEKLLLIVMYVLLITFCLSRILLDNVYFSSVRIFIFFFILAIGALVTIWLYKDMYKKNITSIKKSLEELEELEEER